MQNVKYSILFRADSNWSIENVTNVGGIQWLLLTYGKNTEKNTEKKIVLH